MLGVGAAVLDSLRDAEVEAVLPGQLVALAGLVDLREVGEGRVELDRDGLAGLDVHC